MLKRERANKPINDYKRKYEKVAAEFWEMQKIEQTEEEIEYNEKCSELEQMIMTYSDELNAAETELTAMIKSAKDPNEVEEEYQHLQEIYQNLIDLQKSMEGKSG